MVFEGAQTGGQEMARTKETSVERPAGRTLQRERRTHWLEKLKEPEESSRFHPVRLVSTPELDEREAPQRRASIEIVLTDGRRVVVPEGFVAEDLHRVLSVLEGAPSC